MTRSITYRVSSSRKQMTDGRVRLVFGILSGTDETGADLPDSLLPVFMFRKPDDTPGEISVADAVYTGAVPVHVFNDVDKPTFGVSYPAVWQDLPEADLSYDPELRIDDAVIPSDADLGYFAQDRIITSRAYIFEGNAASAAEKLSQIITQITALCSSYGVYSNATTMMDTSAYPEGWEEEDI